MSNAQLDSTFALGLYIKDEQLPTCRLDLPFEQVRGLILGEVLENLSKGTNLEYLPSNRNVEYWARAVGDPLRAGMPADDFT